MGDVLRDSGDRAGALALYEEALGIDREIAAAEPGRLDWRRDLTVSLNKVGDFARDSGEPDRALALYEEALEIRRGLAAADPTDVGRGKDLGYSLNKVGRSSRESGDAARSLALYEEALGIARELAAARPGRLDLHRDVWVAAIGVAIAAAAIGEPTRAAAAAAEGLEAMALRCGASDAAAVGGCVDEVAEFGTKLPAAAALAPYPEATASVARAAEQTLAILELAPPESRSGALDLALRAVGVWAALEPADGLAVYRELVEEFASDPATTEPSTAANSLGWYLLLLGEAEAAREHFTRLVEATDDSDAQRPYYLDNLGNAHLLLGRTDEALEWYGQLGPWPEFYPWLLDDLAEFELRGYGNSDFPLVRDWAQERVRASQGEEADGGEEQ